MCEKKKQTETYSIEVGRTCFLFFFCLFCFSCPWVFQSDLIACMFFYLFIFLVRKIDVFAFAFLFRCLSTCGVKMCPPVLSCQNNLFSS